MSLTDYLIHAPKPLQEFLKKQWAQAINENVITCECGQRRSLLMAYRCLYCGVWYCFHCAEQHFGKTHQEWLIEQRAKSRQEKRTDLETTEQTKG